MPPFNGFILRKPRLAASNSPTSGAPDTLVLDQDRQDYLNFMEDDSSSSSEYLVIPAATSNLVAGTNLGEENPDPIDDAGLIFQFNEDGLAIKDLSITPSDYTFLDEEAGIVHYQDPGKSPEITYRHEALSVWYTKNDEVTRFDFQDELNRWSPLPGGIPDQLGLLPSNGLMQLARVENELGEPHIAIGSPDEPPVPVSWLLGTVDWNQVVVPSGEAVASVESGEILFATDLISSFEGSPVFQFRKNFFSRDESNGLLGVVGQEDLYLNPIPSSTDKPLLRSRYGSHLRVRTSVDPDNGELVIWNTSTGKLDIDSSLEDQPLYYDGVYNTKEPISAASPLVIGPVPIPSFLSTEMTFTLGARDLEEMILYLNASGKALEEIIIKKDPVQFSNSFEIPSHRVEAYFDGTEVTLQLSHEFAKENEGLELAVGSGDFLLEKGITFRMFRSGADLSNTNGIPDARNKVRVQDEVIIDSIRPGPFAGITQIPLQNIAGYGENTFFRLQQGSKRVELLPDQDVIYHFDQNQIKWATRESPPVYQFTRPHFEFQLPDEVLLNRNFSFELDTGSGYELLEEGDDLLLDFDAGSISFSERKGKTLLEGIGSVVEDQNTLTIDDPLFNLGTIPSEDDEKPLVLLKNEVFRILSYTPTELTLHQNISYSQEAVPFQVIEAPELIYKNSRKEVSLNRRWVFPYIISSVSEDDYVPEGESYEFQVDETSYPHITLSPQDLGTLADEDGNSTTLILPSYYLTSTARFSLYRDLQELDKVPSPPVPNQFSLDPNTGELEFNTQDIEKNPQAQIVLEPHLSEDRSSGDIEVLAADRAIGLPDNLVGSDIEVVVLQKPDQYEVQKRGGVLFFNSVLREGVQVRVTFFEDEDTEIIENLTFQSRETLSLSPGQTSASFGAGKIIDTAKGQRLLVNGSEVTASFNLDTKTVEFDAIPTSRRVQVEYYTTKALGGAQIARLSQDPYLPPVTLRSGADQVFFGDHVGDLAEDTLVIIDTEAYVVQNASYNASSDTTEVSLIPAPPKQIEDPSIFVSTAPIESNTIVIALDKNSIGDQELRAFGDVTSLVDPSHILFLDGAPQIITEASFEEDQGITTITLENELLREYVNPVISISKEPVYPPDTQVLLADSLAFALTQPSHLIRFDESDKGTRLTPTTQYQFLEDGSVVLDPSNIDLPFGGEKWFLSYLARREIGPTRLRGQRFIPKLRASYTKFITATTENEIANSSLLATYSFRNPDSFYFRAIKLNEFREEVVSNISLNTQASGPMTSFGMNLLNYQRGNESLIWEEADLKDTDRVARRFILFHNDIAQGLESYLQILDGRVVGDRSGQFKFTIADDNTPGGEDPVKGNLIPYYANPDGSGQKPDPSQIADLEVLSQEGYIQNAIDDIVVTSRKPFVLETDFGNIPPFTFFFKGTFRPAWKPHRLSRFYPQRSEVSTITPPPRKDPSYSFLRDFRNVLGDLKKEDILSIESVRERPARGWLLGENLQVSADEERVTLEVGMSFGVGNFEAENSVAGPNLLDGDPSNYLPGFREGDIVDLGRVHYEKNDDGVTEREVVIYAQNMLIFSAPSADSDELVLTKVADAAEFGDQRVTDPKTLVGLPATAGYDDTEEGLLPKKHDTLFVSTPNFYRQNFDFGVDSSEGELVNLTLPEPSASLLGQEKFDPETFLDVSLTYKNKETEPYLFPALEGGFVDDNNLTGLPYSNPIPDSEVLSLEIERLGLEKIITNTMEGITTEANLEEGHKVVFPFDLEDPVQNPVFSSPSPYDVLFIQNNQADPESWSGGSTPFKVSKVDGNTVFLAAFLVEEINVNYTWTEAFVGTGERDAGDTTIWLDDTNFDFSGLTGLSGTLEIATSSYVIDTFGNGFIKTTTSISETGPESYHINITGDGDIIGDLHTFTDSTVDFSGLGTDGVLDLTSGASSGSYSIASILSDTLVVETPNISGNGNYEIAVSVNPILVEGTGEQTSLTIWEDLSTDFTVYEEAPELYLHILVENTEGEIADISSYRVINVFNGELEVEEDIQEIGPHEYVLSITKNYAEGNAAVDLTESLNRLFLRVDPATFNIAEGHVLVIPPNETNGGYYRVVEVNSAGYYIELDRDLRQSDGEITDAPLEFPVIWYSYNPRRLSNELPVLEETFQQRLALYTENLPYEASNPSTPSLNVLEKLLDILLGTPVVASNDGEIIDVGGGNWALTSSEDFVGADLSENDFVRIESGNSRGYYLIDEMVGGDAQLRDGEIFFDGLSGGYTNRLSLESGLEYQIYKADEFDSRTYELILYEYYNVVTIIDRLTSGIASTIHDPSTFIGTNLSEHLGDPRTEVVDNHITGLFLPLPVGVEDRQSWITITPSVRDEINAIVKGREALYDLRFSWIDFRINLETGTLPQIERFQQQKAKLERKLAKKLLQLRNQ